MGTPIQNYARAAIGHQVFRQTQAQRPARGSTEDPRPCPATRRRTFLGGMNEVKMVLLIYVFDTLK